MGHFDIWWQIVHIVNGLHALSGRNKRQICGYILTMFNCFPLIKLTEIADNETCTCFDNTPAVYRGGLLQPYSSKFTFGLGLHSYGAFSNAPQSQCGPVFAGRWRGSRKGHLTTSLPMESSWMPPRSTWGIEVMLEEFAAADGRQIVKARTWFILNNLLISFL